MKLRWKDNRIKLGEECLKAPNGSNITQFRDFYHTISILELENSLWYPALQLLHLKSVNTDQLLFSEKLAIIKPIDGLIAVSANMRFTVSCKMDFAWYPFDSQICEVVLLSAPIGKIRKVSLLFPSLILISLQDVSEEDPN